MMWILVYDNEDGTICLMSTFSFKSEKEAMRIAEKYYGYFVEKYDVYPLQMMDCPLIKRSKRLI